MAARSLTRITASSSGSALPCMGLPDETLAPIWEQIYRVDYGCASLKALLDTGKIPGPCLTDEGVDLRVALPALVEIVAKAAQDLTDIVVCLRAERQVTRDAPEGA